MSDNGTFHRVHLNSVTGDELTELPSAPPALHVPPMNGRVTLRGDSIQVEQFGSSSSGESENGARYSDSDVDRVNTPMACDETDLGDLSDVKPFANPEEEAAAFRDPKYKSLYGSEYRREVNRRVAAGLRQSK